jgi:hypothetical protein
MKKYNLDFIIDEVNLIEKSGKEFIVKTKKEV